MSESSHRDILAKRHTDLESKIAEENKRVLPNWQLLQLFKKQKLAIKEKLTKFISRQT